MGRFDRIFWRRAAVSLDGSMKDTTLEPNGLDQMNRRTTPSAKRDDDGFPIRVKFAVPPEGLGKRLDEMQAWLRSNLPSDAYAVHSARTIGGSAMAVYVLTIDDAARFHAAFPDMPLATPPG